MEDLKWYSPFVFLDGAILSFADPITDILTLVEFYRADHKTWFGVRLVFVILLSLLFPLLYLVERGEELSHYIVALENLRRLSFAVFIHFQLPSRGCKGLFSA